MTTLAVVLQSVLVAYFAFSGIAKIAGAKFWTEMFDRLKLPQWFRVVTGFVQLAGVAGLVAGYWDPSWIHWSVIWLVIPMIAAFALHLRVNDPPGKAAPPLVFAAMLIALIAVNSRLAGYFPSNTRRRARTKCRPRGMPTTILAGCAGPCVLPRPFSRCPFSSPASFPDRSRCGEDPSDSRQRRATTSMTSNCASLLTFWTAISYYPFI